MKAGKVKLLLWARDGDSVDNAGEKIVTLLRAARAEAVPMICALTRRTIAKALHMSTKQGVVGVLDTSCVQDKYTVLLKFIHKYYASLQEACKTPLSALPTNISPNRRSVIKSLRFEDPALLSPLSDVKTHEPAEEGETEWLDRIVDSLNLSLAIDEERALVASCLDSDDDDDESLVSVEGELRTWADVATDDGEKVVQLLDEEGSATSILTDRDDVEDDDVVESPATVLHMPPHSVHFTTVSTLDDEDGDDKLTTQGEHHVHTETEPATESIELDVVDKEFTQLSMRDRRNSRRQSANSSHGRWSSYRSPTGLPDRKSLTPIDSPSRNRPSTASFSMDNPAETPDRAIQRLSVRSGDSGRDSLGGMVSGSVVVIDHGSSVTRAGFSGEDLPKNSFPSVVAPTTIFKSVRLFIHICISIICTLSTNLSCSLYLQSKALNEDRIDSPPVSYYVGQRALTQTGSRWPYQNGNISCWEDMEAIWYVLGVLLHAMYYYV